MDQLIDLLDENSCLWDVSNKDYYLTIICCELLRPFAWAFKTLIQNCRMVNATSNSTSVVLTENDIPGAA